MRTYLRDLLAYNRLRTTGGPETFPFSANAFDRLVQSSVSKTPRFMNKLCDSLLRKVLSHFPNDMKPGEAFPDAVVDQALPGLLDLLEDVRGWHDGLGVSLSL
jgi:hypothetical protein